MWYSGDFPLFESFVTHVLSEPPRSKLALSFSIVYGSNTHVENWMGSSSLSRITTPKAFASRKFGTLEFWAIRGICSSQVHLQISRKNVRHAVTADKCIQTEIPHNYCKAEVRENIYRSCVLYTSSVILRGISENGSPFRSTVTRGLCKILGIRSRKTRYLGNGIG